MSDSVLAQLAALKTAPTQHLREQWRRLFETDPPAYNRRFLESRLAYRIQELAYGGLKPATLERLRALGVAVAGGQASTGKRARDADRPVRGTRLIREWRGVEYTVTVTADGYEWNGKLYKSLSPIASAITGTHWNGLVFFGLKSSRGRA